MSKFDEINSGTYYMNIAVFQRTERVRPEAAAEAIAAVEKACEGRDFTIRGFYDIAGFRAEADLMVWWWAPSSDTLQDAYLAFRATELGETLVPVWSQMAVHREAEFNKAHVPNFLQGEKAEDYLCVYPFVRDSEWYLMPEYQRRGMLRQHGQMASEYRDVRANTIASFALGDYEWILAFEAPELHRIVDLMRELRAADARKHMREEQPFFTGRRRELETIVRSWGPVREGLEMAGGCTCC